MDRKQEALLRRAWSEYKSDRPRRKLIDAIRELEAAGVRRADIARAVGTSRQGIQNLLTKWADD